MKLAPIILGMWVLGSSGVFQKGSLHAAGFQSFIEAVPAIGREAIPSEEEIAFRPAHVSIQIDPNSNPNPNPNPNPNLDLDLDPGPRLDPDPNPNLDPDSDPVSQGAPQLTAAFVAKATEEFLPSPEFSQNNCAECGAHVLRGSGFGLCFGFFTSVVGATMSSDNPFIGCLLVAGCSVVGGALGTVVGLMTGLKSICRTPVVRELERFEISCDEEIVQVRTQKEDECYICQVPFSDREENNSNKTVVIPECKHALCSRCYLEHLKVHSQSRTVAKCGCCRGPIPNRGSIFIYEAI